MTTRAPIAATAATTSPEAQAASLWTFVHLRAPGLTSADALELVRELAPSASEPIKSLATRLQRLLASRGVAMKRTHALDAAARLLGHQSWHGVPKQASPAPLQLLSAFSDLNRPLHSWKEAIECFCGWCEGDVIGGGMHIYQIGFGKSSVTFDSPFTSSTDRDGKVAHQLEIRWPTESPGHLAAAISGIETMRRRYEETGKGIVDGFGYSPEEMAKLCLQCSTKERRADEAEREVDERYRSAWMEQHVGSEFDGVVSGVTSFGLFVELAESKVNGLVHVTQLPHDYYHFDPLRKSLKGERKGLSFRLGDPIRVLVLRASVEDRRIDFKPVLPEPGQKKKVWA